MFLEATGKKFVHVLRLCMQDMQLSVPMKGRRRPKNVGGTADLIPTRSLPLVASLNFMPRKLDCPVVCCVDHQHEVPCSGDPCDLMEGGVEKPDLCKAF